METVTPDVLFLLLRENLVNRLIIMLTEMFLPDLNQQKDSPLAFRTCFRCCLLSLLRKRTGQYRRLGNGKKRIFPPGVIVILVL